MPCTVGDGHYVDATHWIYSDFFPQCFLFVMDLLIPSSLYHYSSMNLFKTLFALEAKYYFREFVLEERTDVTDLSAPSSWVWCRNDWCRSKQAALSTWSCKVLGPECNMAFFVDKRSIKSRVTQRRGMGNDSSWSLPKRRRYHCHEMIVMKGK